MVDKFNSFALYSKQKQFAKNYIFPDAVSTPTSPCKDLSSIMRTSFSEPASDDSGILT